MKQNNYTELFGYSFNNMEDQNGPKISPSALKHHPFARPEGILLITHVFET